MSLYKAFLKILKCNLLVIVIYVAIFCAIAVLASGDNNSGYSEVSVDVAVVDYDNSAASKEIVKFLDEKANIKDIENIDDALYLGGIRVYIEIPEGFGEKLFTEDRINVLYEISAASTNGMYLVEKLNDYINKLVVAHNGGVSEDQVFDVVNASLENEAKPVVIAKDSSLLSDVKYYMNYLSYILTAVITTIISTVMLSFGSKDVRRRNDISPVNISKFNLILFGLNLLFSFVLLGIMLMVCGFMYNWVVFKGTGLLFILNSVIYVAFIVSVGYLIGIACKKKQVSSAVINIVSLAPSFLCGVFVPQELLNIPISKALAPYYYVRANELIYKTGEVNQDVINCFIFQIVSTIVVLGVCLIIVRKNRKSEN